MVPFLKTLCWLVLGLILAFPISILLVGLILAFIEGGSASYISAGLLMALAITLMFCGSKEAPVNGWIAFLLLILCILMGLSLYLCYVSSKPPVRLQTMVAV